MVGVACLLIAAMIQQFEKAVDLTNEKIHAHQLAEELSSTLSASMAVRLNLISSLNAFVSTHQEFTNEKFDHFASLLKKDLRGVLSLQLAPGGVVTYLTEVERNKEALGHNLLADPKRRELAEAAIRDRRLVISEPIDLIQGGRAIIARRPIFLPDGKKGNDFWGFAIVLIDIDNLLQDAIRKELTQDYLIAIRGKGEPGTPEETFVGDASTFENYLALTEVQLPGTNWQIAISENPAHRSIVFIRSPWYWLAAACFSVAMGLGSFSFINRPQLMKRKIINATSTLTSELQRRKAAEEKARYVSQHDSLTGLPNRNLFFELSHLALERAKRDKLPLAVLFIDIDGFKAVNDSFGHKVGDELLCKITDRLLNRIRKSDVVARFGGDEFLVLLTEECNKNGAGKVAGEIIEKISRPFVINEVPVHVGASIGIAIFPNDGSSIEDLIEKSDEAMYRAKNSGKNCYFFT